MHITAEGVQNATVRVSYIEIYNEEVKDLLHPATPSKSISIRERADGTILLSGVREVISPHVLRRVHGAPVGSRHCFHFQPLLPFSATASIFSHTD